MLQYQESPWNIIYHARFQAVIFDTLLLVAYDSLTALFEACTVSQRVDILQNKTITVPAQTLAQEPL